jgi:serine protease Do
MIPSAFVRQARAVIASVVLVAGAAAWQAPAQARGAPESFADLAERVQPAVVNISTSQQVEVDSMMRRLPPGMEEFFRRFGQTPPGGEEGSEGQDPRQGKQPPAKPATREARSLGSGFIIDATGYVVTNNHVVSGADGIKPVDKITVILSDGTKLDAKLIGRDQASDLALLKVESKTPLPAVKFGNSKSMRVGDWVMAVGNPFGLGGTVTAGIVSALHRDLNAGAYDQYIQTDAAINRGNSGGPMFNLDGEVIGISTAIFSPTGGNVGIGFAIPSDYASKVVDQLRVGGKVRRGFIGVRIQAVTEDIASSLGLTEEKGAIVSSVEPTGPAARAGVRSGDIILSFNGQEVATNRSLPSIVSETGIGRTVDMTVLRNGKTVKLRVTVGELPDQVASAAEPESEKKSDKADPKMAAAQKSLGLTLVPLDAAARAQLEFPKDVEGALISAVDPNSDAGSKGIQRGDLIVAINQQPVTKPDQAAALVAEAAKSGRPSVLIRLRRGADFFHVGVKLTEGK